MTNAECNYLTKHFDNKSADIRTHSKPPNHQLNKWGDDDNALDDDHDDDDDDDDVIFVRDSRWVCLQLPSMHSKSWYCHI